MKIKVAVFSPNDPRPWVRAENTDLMIRNEEMLLAFLRKADYEAHSGGEDRPKDERIAWNTRLVREHAEKLASHDPDVIIINEGSWTFPYDSRDAVNYFGNALRKKGGNIPRVIIYCYKDTQVPGMVAGMAVAGALKRVGIPFHMVYGRLDQDARVGDNLKHLIGFSAQRRATQEKVESTIQELRNQKYLAFGGMSLKMCTTTADVDQWAKIFGISYEALDQSVLKDRALTFINWKGKPGESEYTITDTRIATALKHLYENKNGTFDFTRPKLRNINKFAYQLSYYYAAMDIMKEYNGTFLGIKCQDELSASDCTMCLATAFLSNSFGPCGSEKQIVPTACENDMDSSLTQLIMYLMTGQPAGFGDFRDVENGVLAIVNCGQHPPYFYGKPDDNATTKLRNTEYMGQEVFYAAGGSSVRGRTPGGETITVARLARENLRYHLVATVMQTQHVDKKEHDNYNPSWPIIKGKLPISTEQIIELWPCNHLGFCYGDITPQLVEFAHRMGLGYTVYDSRGMKHSAIS